MSALRALFSHRRQLALGLVLLALAMKALLPAGHMVSSSPERFVTIAICATQTGLLQTVQVPIGPAGDSAPAGSKGAKSDACAFSGLANQALGGADPLLLALAIAFILLLGFAPVRSPNPRPIAHLYPPQRGPPAVA